MLAELEEILKDVLCEDNIEGINYADIDSLDKLDFVFRVENHFDISLHKHDLATITSLQQMAELIEKCTIQK